MDKTALTLIYLQQRKEKVKFAIIEKVVESKDFPFPNDFIIAAFKETIYKMQCYYNITKLKKGLYRNLKNSNHPKNLVKAHYLKRKAIAKDGYFKNLSVLMKIDNCGNIIPMLFTLLHNHHITERYFVLYFPEFTKRLIKAAETLEV